MRGLFDLDASRKRLAELEELSLSPDLWNDQQKAQTLLKEKHLVENNLKNYDDLNKGLKDNIELAELAEMEGDDGLLDDIEATLKKLNITAGKFETECLFSGEADMNNCFLEINAGAGGTESHDWASIMMRMYLRFAERMNFKTEILNIASGEEAGIKSCAIRIIGHNAYGWLKTEGGRETHDQFC